MRRLLQPESLVSKVFSEFFSVFPQYLMPKQALTIFAGKVANAEAGPITTLIIRWFIKRYGVFWS